MAGYILFAFLGIAQLILTMHWERVIRLPLSDGMVMRLRTAVGTTLAGSIVPVLTRKVDLQYALVMLGMVPLFFLLTLIPFRKRTLWRLAHFPRSKQGNLGSKRDVTIHLVADGDTYRVASSDELFGYTKFDMIRITTWDKEMRVTAPLGELEHYFQAIGLEQRPEPVPMVGPKTLSWQQELEKGSKGLAVAWLQFAEVAKE